ncbi:MAG: hypothetical protein GXO26_08440 [Crenarchaeota archaeon]|nr:hypothetical protein [Thermoproteota archaeon]
MTTYREDEIIRKAIRRADRLRHFLTNMVNMGVALSEVKAGDRYEIYTVDRMRKIVNKLARTCEAKQQDN